MPLNTQNLLEVAKNLLKDPVQNEEYYRSSTNRAYYSVFHECSETAKIKLNTVPSYGANASFKHDELCNVFNNHKFSIVPTKLDKDIWRIGYLLRQIKDLRVEADYKSSITFTKLNATDAIQHSNEIMTLLQGI